MNKELEEAFAKYERRLIIRTLEAAYNFTFKNFEEKEAIEQFKSFYRIFANAVDNQIEEEDLYLEMQKIYAKAQN